MVVEFNEVNANLPLISGGKCCCWCGTGFDKPVYLGFVTDSSKCDFNCRMSGLQYVKCNP